jgi:cytochrome c
VFVTRVKKCLLILAISISLTACSKPSGNEQLQEVKAPILSAATLGEQQILTVDEHMKAEPYASSSTKSGKQQAQICRACHSFVLDGPNMIGPALYGLFGRQAGEHSGFGYSPVLKNADFVWTPRALDAWLAQPGSFLPGNRMTFAGVLRKQDRDDLIAFLLKETSGKEIE